MLRHLPRRPRREPSRWLAAAATLALTATIGVAIASPAYAGTFPIKDGFENGGWTTKIVPGMTNVEFGSGEVTPHGDTEIAYLDAFPNAPAEAQIFRVITLDNGAPLPGVCRASVYSHVMFGDPSEGAPPSGNVQVFLKIHSGGPTGQVISVWGYDFYSTAWDRLDFSPMRWPADSRSVTVEIATYRGFAVFDDFTLSC